MYTRAGDDFELVNFVSAESGVVYFAAPRFPLMRWPNGHWCLEANLYIEKIHKRDRGSGAAARPDGTAVTYAAHLNHLLRFCFRRRIGLTEMVDDEFTEFVDHLSEERDELTGKTIRDISAVRAIATTTLSFIAYCGDLIGADNLVGLNGQIRAFPCRNSTTRRRKDDVQTGIRHFHHSSFPTKGPVKRRRPISSGSLALLRKAAYSEGSLYVQKRRATLLLLLEIVGGRREEIGRLKVENLLHTLSANPPKIELPWLAKKRGKDRGRAVAVSDQAAEQILSFIRYTRPLVLRARTRVNEETGALFLDARRGTPIRHETLSKEFRKLAAKAGLTEQACMHMLRHRFITDLVKKYLFSLSQQLNDPTELKHAILSYNSLLSMIREEMGFASVESLKVYIHEAYEEFTHAAEIKEDVRELKRAADLAVELDRILLENQGDSGATIRKMRDHIDKVLHSR